MFFFCAKTIMAICVLLIVKKILIKNKKLSTRTNTVSHPIEYYTLYKYILFYSNINALSCWRTISRSRCGV